METIFSEHAAPFTVLAPVADRYNGNPSSEGVNMGLADHVTFVLSEAAGGTGTAKLEVTAESAAGGDAEAIKFRYRTKAHTTSVPGTLSDKVLEYTTVPGANKDVIVEVQGIGLPVSKGIVRLRITEVVNDPVLAGVIAIATRLRYAGAELPELLVD